MNKPHSDLRLKTILGHLRKNKYSLQSQHSTPFCSECSASTPLIQDKEYEYTHNSSHLSREQRQFYEENGYIIIKKLVNDDILDKCRDHFLDVCNGRSPAGGMFLMKEPTLQKVGATGEHLIYKIQDLLYDEVFSLYTTLPELLDYVQCFTGPNITAIHSMLINKPPDAQLTTIHPLHQDLLYFPFRPANLIVGTWTAMERIDQENGCLVVCPGSHRSNQLYQHGTEEFQTGPYKTFYGVKSKQKEQPIPLCMEKGDTVFLHPLIIHGSGPNRSRVFHRQYVWWNTVPILCRAPRSTASPPPTSPRLTTASPPPTTPRLTSASPPPPPPHHTTAPLPPTSTRLTSASPPPPLPRHTTSPLPPPSSRLAIVPPPPPSPRLAIVPPPSPSTCLTTAPLLPSSPRLLLPILAASPGLNQNHPPPMVKIIHPTPHNSNISQFCTAH